MTTGEALLLDDVAPAVWHAFQLEGPSTIRDAGGVHFDHWRRSRTLGASPGGISAEDRLLRGEALRLRTEPLEMLQLLGATALRHAARQVSAHDFVLVVADPDGVVVRTEGGGGFSSHARRVRLIEGATWSEAARGTNAIGTALAERRPTIVLGRGHFASSYHDLACYAAPVLDAHGNVIAIVDATSSVEHKNPKVGNAVFSAAQVLSELLRLEAYAGVGSSMLKLLSRTLDRSAEPGLLIEAPGRVTRANAPARSLLGDVPAGSDATSLLDLSWAALVRAALSPGAGGLIVERGARRRFRVHAEPVMGAGEQPLAVVARLTPVHARRSRPTPTRDTRPAVAGLGGPFERIFADDAALRQTIEWAGTLARSDLAMMLLAETGAGKELFAQAIHAASSRAKGPFVPVNCGAVSATLLESELFGYAPGAFTGADRLGRTGLFHAADGGTLFLDEVAEMPLRMQAALLRVLDSGAFQRVGDTRQERSQVRLICATCRDLERGVADGSFRQDLYYRLKGAALRLPPLRERTDLLALAQHLVRERAPRHGWSKPPEFSEAAARQLLRHTWPGNVRELAASLEVALVSAFATGAARIGSEHLPGDIGSVDPSVPHAVSSAVGAAGALSQAEAETVRRVLAQHPGNVSAAARELGVARSTLYRLAKRLGVRLRPAREGS